MDPYAMVTRRSPTEPWSARPMPPKVTPDALTGRAAHDEPFLSVDEVATGVLIA